MATWKQITEAEIEELLRRELSTCSSQEKSVYERTKIPLRRVSLLRGKKIEPVFAVAEHDGQLLIFDDVEQGFEWCREDADGIIRSYSCSQAGLQARLFELVR